MTTLIYSQILNNEQKICFQGTAHFFGFDFQFFVILNETLFSFWEFTKLLESFLNLLTRWPNFNRFCNEH